MLVVKCTNIDSDKKELLCKKQCKSYLGQCCYYISFTDMATHFFGALCLFHVCVCVCVHVHMYAHTCMCNWVCGCVVKDIKLL